MIETSVYFKAALLWAAVAAFCVASHTTQAQTSTETPSATQSTTSYGTLNQPLGPSVSDLFDKDDISRPSIVPKTLGGSTQQNTPSPLTRTSASSAAASQGPQEEPAPVEEQGPQPIEQTRVVETVPADTGREVSPALTSLVVTVGAIALAIAATLIAIRVGRGAQQTIAQWRARFAIIEAKLDRAETVFSAQPHIVVIWEEDSDNPAQGWGKPKVLGNSGTLATLLRYAEGTDGATPIETILEGLAGQTVEFGLGEPIAREDGIERSASLVEAIQDLRWNGTSFSLTISTDDGRVIEANGRPAGGQAVVWLSDVTAKDSLIGMLKEQFVSSRREGEQLRKLLDSAPFPAWHRNQNAKLSWVNKAYSDAVEASSPEDVVEQDIELDKDARALSTRALEQGQPCVEKRYVIVKGKRRALDLIETPHEVGSVGMALDVTGLDQAEKKLKQHMDAHAETLDKLASAVAIFGSNKQLKFYNQAYANLCQLEPAILDLAPTYGEILDRLRAKRLLPEQADFKAWRDQQLSMFMEVKEQPDQLWHLPDGRHLRVVCQAHPMGGLLFIYEDVTDRFQLETDLNTLSKVQRATLDNLSEGVAVFGSNGRLELKNKSFTEIWKLGAETNGAEFHVSDLIELGRTFFDDDTEWRRMADKVATVREERHNLTGRLERSDGRYVDYALLPLPNGATLFTCLDVTDTTRITRALQERNEALEAADKLKSEFISHVSYQLRTPLTSIKGFCEMLDQEIVGPLNERQRQYSDAILEASNQLMVLMDDILDLARIEAGVMSIETSEVDAYDVLSSTIELARREAEEKGISLKLSANEDLGEMCADEKRLRQIVFNLLSNALTFTPAGGTIDVDGDRSPHQIRISVTDTGQGIDPEHQPIVFDRFESRTSTGQKRGPGLGLALVRSFVELHGGWVSLESEPRVGTKVVCHFPITGPEEPAQPLLERRAAE